MHSIPVLLSMGNLKVVVYFEENRCAPFSIICSVTKVSHEKYFDGYLFVNNFIKNKYQFCGISVNKRDFRSVQRVVSPVIQVIDPVQQDLTSFMYLTFEKSKRQ